VALSALVVALLVLSPCASAEVSNQLPGSSADASENQGSKAESEVERAQRFRQIIEQATQDFRSGRYDQAVEGYLSAYQLRRRPPLLFNIAQVHRKAGRTQDALKFYDDFLREDPQSELAPEVRNYVKVLRERPQNSSATDERAGSAPVDNFLGTEEQRQTLFRTHIDSAVMKFKAADYEAAVDEYWAAYGLKPQKIIVFNVAQAYRKAGRWAESLTLFQRYLRDEPESPLAGEVEAYIAEARARLRTQRLTEQGQSAERLAKANAVLAERLIEIREIDRKIVAQSLALTPKPVYRRVWFWTLLGTATVGLALGIGLGVGLQPKLRDADLGQAILQY
jgi:tetratricopeptide (TPR) repeat protein